MILIKERKNYSVPTHIQFTDRGLIRPFRKFRNVPRTKLPFFKLMMFVKLFYQYQIKIWYGLKFIFLNPIVKKLIIKIYWNKYKTRVYRKWCQLKDVYNLSKWLDFIIKIECCPFNQCHFINADLSMVVAKGVREWRLWGNFGSLFVYLRYRVEAEAWPDWLRVPSRTFLKEGKDSDNKCYPFKDKPKNRRKNLRKTYIIKITTYVETCKVFRIPRFP